MTPVINRLYAVGCGFWLALAAVTVAGTAAAADRPAVIDAWARATPPGVTTGAVYLTVSGGSEPDRLIGARTDAAAAAELHTELSENGVLTMKKLDALSIPAGVRVTLAPGHDHLMLMGLKGPLKPGDTIHLTLTFERAGEVAVTVPVRDARTSAHAAHDHPSMPTGEDHGEHDRKIPETSEH